MKHFFRLSLFIISLFFISSCQKDEISASVEVITLNNSLSDSYSLNITCNTVWRIETNHNWMGFSSNEGEGSQTIEVFPRSVNTNDSDRNGKFTIVAGTKNKAAVSITVTQSASDIKILNKPDQLNFSFSGSNGTINVQSNCDWRVEIEGNENSRFNFEPQFGSGDATISITCEQKDVRKNEYALIKIKSGSAKDSVDIFVEGLENNSPATPTLLTPADESDDVHTIIHEFKWSCEDPDGDIPTYTVMISEDLEEWKSTPSSSNSIKSSYLKLNPSTTYYWKVVADDGNLRENSTSVSEIRTFTTSPIDYSFSDGEYTVYQRSSLASPVKLLFIGDGYVASDFTSDGKFQSDMIEGIEAFFSVEPYKSYRDYFNVYILANYSQESGATITSAGISKNTFYQSVIAGGGTTSVSCNYDKVFKTISDHETLSAEINEADFPNMSIVMAINEDIYAGTCIMWSDGKNIAMCPVSRMGAPNSMTTYGNTLIHEAGGHGWGRLSDEYVNYQTQITSEKSDQLKAWQGYGSYLNVSLTNDPSKVSWSSFIGDSFPRVGLYEGGYLYSQGVWRSESTNCMINNIRYFAVYCRYLQVRRIYGVIGEEFTMAKFLEKDVQEYPDVVGTKAPDDFIPLGPPILIK